MKFAIYKIKGVVVYFLNDKKMSLAEILEQLKEKDTFAYSLLLLRLENALQNGMEENSVYEGVLEPCGNWELFKGK